MHLCVTKQDAVFATTTYYFSHFTNGMFDEKY